MGRPKGSKNGVYAAGSKLAPRMTAMERRRRERKRLRWWEQNRPPKV